MRPQKDGDFLNGVSKRKESRPSRAGSSLDIGSADSGKRAARFAPTNVKLVDSNTTILDICGSMIENNEQLPPAPNAVTGYRFASGIAVGALFAIRTVLLFIYPWSKQATIQMADELAERRRKLAPEPAIV